MTQPETAWPPLKRNSKMGENEASLPNMSLPDGHGEIQDGDLNTATDLLTSMIQGL
jgi:hypothetical protein